MPPKQQKFFPDKTFSGLTLKEFRATLQPCREVRRKLAELATETKLARYRRLSVDRIGRPVLLRVIHAVRGDPDVGEDSGQAVLSRINRQVLLQFKDD